LTGKYRLAVLAVLALLVSAQAATAKPDRFGSTEMFPGEGVIQGGMQQHGMTEGHLPPVSRASSSSAGPR
jgi:hypothetical protein